MRRNKNGPISYKAKTSSHKIGEYPSEEIKIGDIKQKENQNKLTEI